MEEAIVAMQAKARQRLERSIGTVSIEIRERPGFETWMRIGEQLHCARRLEEANAIFEMVVEHYPNEVNGWMALAALRMELARPLSALQACNCGLQLAPDDYEVLSNAALVLQRIGDLPAAEFVARKAAGAPDTAAACRLLVARICASRQKHVEAADEFAAYLELVPGDVAARIEFADVMVATRRYDDASFAYECILSSKQEMTAARIGLAFCRAACGYDEEARELLAAAHRDDPAGCAGWRPFIAADVTSGRTRLDVDRFRVAVESEAMFDCDWSRRSSFERWLYERLTNPGLLPLNDPDTPFVTLGLELPPECRRRLAENVAVRLSDDMRGVVLARCAQRKKERLRIGYLTGDMRDHPVGRLLSPVFVLHDRSRFEVFVYHSGPVVNCFIRTQAMHGADCFRDVEHLPLGALSQLIAADGIDIVVDLSGYTLHGRTGALAARPAPVQMHYLGFLGTLGAPFLDYAIVDRYVIPPKGRASWSESLVYLPGSMIVAGDRMQADVVPTSRSEHGLPETGFVFACLNATWKIEPDVFSIWMRLLKKTPLSVLWLFDGGVPSARANLIRAADRDGIDTNRLIFADRVSYDAYLRRYQHIDLVLNTRTYSGNTTTLEALANAVPVLSFAGSETQSRLAASMLQAFGETEMVVGNREMYECVAHRLASDSKHLAHVKERIRRQLATSPLFDIASRARELESAYEAVWARHRAGLPPCDIDVPAGGACSRLN